MEYFTFFKDIKIRILNSYVFIGVEEFVKDRAYEDLKTHVLKGANESFNFQILSEDTELYEVVAAVNTLPFMADRRLVVWNNPKVLTGDMSDKEMKMVTEVMDSLHDGVCLLIFIKGKPDTRRKAYKLLEKRSTVVEFNPLSDLQAAKWVGSYFTKNGKEIDLLTAETIVFKVGTSVRELNNEVIKIAASMGDRKRVEKKDLRVLTGSNVDVNIFNLISSTVYGTEKNGLKKICQLLDSGESSQRIRGAFAFKLRSYYQVQALLATGMKPDEIKGIFGNSKVVAESKKLSGQQVRKGVETLEYVDYAVKNGLMTERIGVEYAFAQIFLVK